MLKGRLLLTKPRNADRWRSLLFPMVWQQVACFTSYQEMQTSARTPGALTSSDLLTQKGVPLHLAPHLVSKLIPMLFVFRQTCVYFATKFHFVMPSSPHLPKTRQYGNGSSSVAQPQKEQQESNLNLPSAETAFVVAVPSNRTQSSSPPKDVADPRDNDARKINHVTAKKPKLMQKSPATRHQKGAVQVQAPQVIEQLPQVLYTPEAKPTCVCFYLVNLKM